MHEDAFFKVIEKIRQKDPRYDVDAYFFVREALEFTSKALNKPTEGDKRHVTGKELLDGMRAYAVQEFGPMALTVLRTWGIGKTDDFGEIVFNLVESKVLGRTEEDKKEDFAHGYDFHEAFAKPFLPRSRDHIRKSSRSGARRPPAGNGKK